MDEAERIPIDIGYEVAAPGLAQTDPRATVRADGTLVIDLSTPQPCTAESAAEPSTEEEIVVCADAPEGQQVPLARPHTPKLNEKVGEALNAKIGPVELGSIRNSDGTYSFGARVRF